MTTYKLYIIPNAHETSAIEDDYWNRDWNEECGEPEYLGECDSVKDAAEAVDIEGMGLYYLTDQEGNLTHYLRVCGGVHFKDRVEIAAGEMWSGGFALSERFSPDE